MENEENANASDDDADDEIKKLTLLTQFATQVVIAPDSLTYSDGDDTPLHRGAAASS